jgi:hypothetical protein
LVVVRVDSTLTKIQAVLEVLVVALPTLQDYQVMLVAQEELEHQDKEIMVDLALVVRHGLLVVVVVLVAQDLPILVTLLVAQEELDYQVLFLAVLCSMQVAVVVAAAIQDQVELAEMVVAVLAEQENLLEQQVQQALPIEAVVVVALEILQVVVLVVLVLLSFATLYKRKNKCLAN